MTTKSQEIEQARKELELLKEKERSLEAKLGLLSKNEEYQYAHNVTNSLLDEPLPVNYVLSNENLFQRFKVKVYILSYLLYHILILS